MKRLFISIIIALVAFSSCEHLELTPLDKLSEADVWHDEALTTAYINATYHSLPQELNQQMLAAACDESYCIHNYGSLRLVQQGEMISDNVSSLSNKIYFWPSAYRNIRNINIFFEQMETSRIDDAVKKKMIGEMKFIRAFIYANLIWRYGGVPLITTTFGLTEDYSVTRASYDECVDFIIKELDEAVILLPDRQPNSEQGRASGHACMALKSRVFLYAASPFNNSENNRDKWQKAADATEALLNAGYTLNDDYANTFLEDNNEIIFARSFSQATAPEMHMWNGRNGSNGWGAQNPTQNLVNAYEMKTGEYDPQQPYANRDPRLGATILHNGSMWAGRETETFRGGLDSPESSIGAWNSSQTSYFLKKFIPEDIPPTGSSIRPDNPYIFFRYAEILLNYAEAKFELGDEETAREYLNKVRGRKSVEMPPVTASGNELKSVIRNERRVELAFEGHRYFDVRRWNIAMETENEDLLAMRILKAENGDLSYEIYPLMERTFIEKHYLVPISRAEIDKSLGSLSQNPGY